MARMSRETISLSSSMHLSSVEDQAGFFPPDGVEDAATRMFVILLISRYRAGVVAAQVPRHLHYPPASVRNGFADRDEVQRPQRS